MTEKIWFSLKFEFESKDMKKALRLHNLLKEYGAVSNISKLKQESINKDVRCDAILDAIKPGKVYTTGELWRACKRNGLSAGEKTFQRDLNTLIIRGEIVGFRKIGHGGNTTIWSRKENGKDTN